MEYKHVPVMLPEVLKQLAPRPGGRYIDCTLGGAGYTLAIAEAIGASGQVTALDQDELAIQNAQAEIKRRGFKNISLVRENFKNLAAIFADQSGFNGIVFDLGLSSAQLDDETRGFSFKGDRPLDMSFGLEPAQATSEIVNRYSHGELARLFRELGEERRAGKLASAILEARRQKRIESTADLVAIIEKLWPLRPGLKIHPATKAFQALRMETNGELEALSSALEAASHLLKNGGRLVVVSFHSGEDRVVKKFLKNKSDLVPLVKRPLVPSMQEIAVNPRARSAKLRAAIKIDNFQIA